MSEPSQPPPETAISAQPLPPAGPRGWVTTAWIAILATAGALTAVQFLGKQAEQRAPSTDPANYALLEFQTRLLVGAKSAGKVQGPALDPLIKQANAFNQNRVSQRLRAITVL